MCFSHSSEADHQETVMRLEYTNRRLSVMVEKYEKQIAILNVSTA
jgi:hypothetical protein